MTPDRLGLVIGAIFGLIYVEVNARAIPSPAGVVLQVLGLLAFIGLLLMLRRRAQVPQPGHDGSRPGLGRGFWLVVAAEVAAIAGGNTLLNGALDVPEGVLPWISFVVGVHFVGLAKVWRDDSLGWLGAGIAALGALGLGVAVTGGSHAAIAAIAGVGPGALLLSGGWWAVIRGGRPAPE